MADYLIHHGTKGMKWGIRKYQNDDGSLTPAGKQRYGHSLKGTIYRLSAGAHEKIYSKIGNKTMRGMSKSTAAYARKRADEADAAAAARKEAKIARRNARSEAKIAKANAKAESSKTGIMKRHYIRKAENEAYLNDRKNRIANAQGLRNKLSEAYGYKDFAASQRALEKINSRSSKTVIGLQKRKYENQAYNNKAFAKYGDRMAKASTGEKIVERLTRTELMTTPIRSVYGGRKTTMAKEMVISSLTAGYGNMILDAGAIAKKEVATIRRKK